MRKNDMEQTPVAEHSFIAKHSILLDERWVVASNSYFPGKVRVAIIVIKNHNNFSKGKRYKLHNMWKRVIHISDK